MSSLKLEFPLNWEVKGEGGGRLSKNLMQNEYRNKYHMLSESQLINNSYDFL